MQSEAKLLVETDGIGVGRGYMQAQDGRVRRSGACFGGMHEGGGDALPAVTGVDVQGGDVGQMLRPPAHPVDKHKAKQLLHVRLAGVRKQNDGAGLGSIAAHRGQVEAEGPSKAQLVEPVHGFKVRWSGIAKEE